MINFSSGQAKPEFLTGAMLNGRIGKIMPMPTQVKLGHGLGWLYRLEIHHQVVMMPLYGQMQKRS